MTLSSETQGVGALLAAARSTNGFGTGIAGLTERAQSLGGHIDAGPLPDGRYRLSVEIPEAFV